LGKYEMVTTTGTPTRLTLKLIEELLDDVADRGLWLGFTGTLVSS